MKQHFLQMIKDLRGREEILLYDHILEIGELEKIEVTKFLESEYQHESLEYPHVAPTFDDEAALWSAEIIYVAAQLMLYRKNSNADMEALFPDFKGEITAGSVLSADLCLRFLPDIIVQLKLIDPADYLIEVLHPHLYQWHYSGISYPLDSGLLNFDIINKNPCLYQKYINRVIEYKNISLAKNQVLANGVSASLSIFSQELWNEFKIETITSK